MSNNGGYRGTGRADRTVIEGGMLGSVFCSAVVRAPLMLRASKVVELGGSRIAYFEPWCLGMQTLDLQGGDVDFS